jgi:Tfp pilus assembly protein FimT
VQLARAEAVRRNATVQIVLTDDAPEISNVNSATLSVTGANWMIRVWDPSVGQYSFVEGKAGLEGAGTIGAPAVQMTGDVTNITYNGFGSTTGGGTFSFTNPTGGACAPGGPMRCLNVTVANGGQARMCDPAVDPIANPGDTRAC